MNYSDKGKLDICLIENAITYLYYIYGGEAPEFERDYKIPIDAILFKEEAKVAIIDSVRFIKSKEGLEFVRDILNSSWSPPETDIKREIKEIISHWKEKEGQESLSCSPSISR
ncbi:MAG: hypothetical protein WBE18_08280 [Gammaproteobacteria bacterium]